MQRSDIIWPDLLSPLLSHSCILTADYCQDLEATNLRALQAGEKVPPHKVTCGLLLANTPICWEKMEGSGLNLTGKSKGKVERTQIINPDWDFSKMGIGGLDTQFNAIFRLECLPQFWQINIKFNQMIIQTSIRIPSFPPGDHGAAGLQTRQGNSSVRTARHREDTDGPTDWSNVELPRTQDCKRTSDP